jgi:ADP-ribosylglycohydrolase
MLSAPTLYTLAREEIIQLQQEGCDTAVLEELLEASEGADDTYVRGRLLDLFEMARRLRPAPDFPYDEPNDLGEIRERTPQDAERWTSDDLSEDWLRDRLTGAWLGRCIGCMMGKPVEGKSRWEIELILREDDAYPLDGYFPALETLPEGVTYKPASDECLAPNIDRGVRDDDTDYTVLGLMLGEESGVRLSSDDVANAWLTRLPYLRTYTAERAAMRNLVYEMAPPESARWMNPYREWIGAQIRADGLAYCAPGRPQLAATYCYRDAVVSHTKNGVYGEMFFGALISAALGAEHLDACIWRALAEIPHNCRLAEAIRECIVWCDEDDSWEQTWDRIMDSYGHYHQVHTINNALLCIMGLLHGAGDLRRSIAIAVMGGLDTDCNGATVGSVIGALLGSDAVPADLSNPLNDTLETALSGVGTLSTSELVERSVQVGRKLHR